MMAAIRDIFRWFFNYKFILFLFLLYYLLVAMRMLYQADLNNHPWILGDWLINYHDGGFKRRGLAGSLFMLIYDFTGLRIQIQVLILQVFLYLFFFRNIFLILSDKNISPLYITLFFSPVAFMLPYLEQTIIGRKEIIMFAVFSYTVYLLANNKMTAAKEYVILVALFVATFFHEILVFYLPYFFISYLYFRPPHEAYKAIIKYASVVIVPAAIIYFFGGDVNQGDSFRLLKERGVEFSSTGMLNWNENVLHYVNARWETFWLYGISLFLIVLHLILYLRIDSGLTGRFKFLILLAFVYSLPIFIMATDWGRWMYVHMILMLCLLGSMRKKSYSWTEHAIIPDKMLALCILVGMFNLTWKLSHTDVGFLWMWQELPPIIPCESWE